MVLMEGDGRESYVSVDWSFIGAEPFDWSASDDCSVSGTILTRSANAFRISTVVDGLGVLFNQSSRAAVPIMVSNFRKWRFFSVTTSWANWSIRWARYCKLRWLTRSGTNKHRRSRAGWWIMIGSAIGHVFEHTGQESSCVPPSPRVWINVQSDSALIETVNVHIKSCPFGHRQWDCLLAVSEVKINIVKIFVLLLGNSSFSIRYLYHLNVNADWFMKKNGCEFFEMSLDRSEKDR